MWKNRTAWLLLFLGALALYLFENNTGTRILLLTAALYPACSAAALYLPRLRAEAALTLPPAAGRGAAVSGVLRLRNASALPLFRAEAVLEIRNRLTGERQTLRTGGAIRGRGEIERAFSLLIRHCGSVDVRVPALYARDALGLFSRRLPCQTEKELLVPPRTGPVGVSLADAAGFPEDRSASAQKPGYDPGETLRVREYVPGDPVRQIHWKLSRKTDTLLVRDFGLPVADRMLLLLETGVSKGGVLSPEALDETFDLLFSVSEALLAQDIAHTVGWRDLDEGDFAAAEIAGGADLDALRTRLLSAPVSEGRETVAACFAESPGRRPFAHVLLIGPEAAADAGLLCHGGRVTALLPASAPPPAETWDGAEMISCPRDALRLGTLELEL